jgi:hypothetical protein
MREARRTQPSLTENWLDADHAKELQEVSRLLDEPLSMVGCQGIEPWTRGLKVHSIGNQRDTGGKI